MMSDINRIPPHDIDAEVSVLAAMLFEKASVDMAINIMVPDDFYTPVHKVIFECMVATRKKNMEVDVVILKSELIEKGVFDQIGGMNCLSSIVGAFVTSANLKSYIRIVQEKAFRRRCIKNAYEITKNAYEGDFDVLIQSLESKSPVVKHDGVSTLPEIVENAIIKIGEQQKSGDKFTGLATGFYDLDLMTGGLQNTDLIILGGRPSMGKTALALNIISNSAKKLKEKNKISIFFSLEMSKEKIGIRFFSSQLKIPSEKFRLGTLTDDDWKRMENLSDDFVFKNSNVFIEDDPNVTTNDMYSVCHSLKGKVNKDIGLIVIDYLQFIKTADSGNRNNDLTKVSRALKSIAKEFNCPVVVLSQLSRGPEGRINHRPMLSDLRESGAIEQDADVVALMYRDEYYNPDTESKGVAEVIIAKQRDGRTGCVNLAYIPKYVSFGNLAWK